MPRPFEREDGLDPAYHLIPHDQLDRVLSQDMCDIDRSFLGFTDIYLALAMIIPRHWTIVDLGCAFSPQALIFKDHAAYIGVDAVDGKERFTAANTTHYDMTISEFCKNHAHELPQETTFAICSYVPPWYGDNPRELAKQYFTNVFTYYPAGRRIDAASTYSAFML